MRRRAGQVQHARRSHPRADVLGVGLFAGDAGDQHEHSGSSSSRAQIGKQLERHAPHRKPFARIGVEHHELAALGRCSGLKALSFAQMRSAVDRIGRDLRHVEAVHRPRPFDARHCVPGEAERVHEIEKRVRSVDVRVEPDFVRHKVAGVEALLIEAVKADARRAAEI